MSKAYLFDTETTGKEEPQIMEAAWVPLLDLPEVGYDLDLSDTYDDSGYVERFCTDKPPELGALAVHHILWEDVKGYRDWKKFKLPEDVGYLVGYNIDYDWEAACNSGPQPECKRIDLMSLSRYVWPELDSYKQTAVLYYISENKKAAQERAKNAHDAQCDVQIAFEILKAMILELQPESWEQMWEFSEESRIPLVMPFGKHKGEAIEDVPKDYKKWLLRQADVDPYLVKALENSI